MLRRCIVAIGVSASLAWPCTAGLAEIPKLDFKRLDDPYAPRSPAHLKLRPRLDISRVADAVAAPVTSPRPTDQIGNLAKLRTVPVLGEGLVVTTGAMRNMRDIDREIDRAVLANPLGEDPTGLGQAKTVYVGIGYDNGRIAEPGWHLRLSAGASVDDLSIRGRMRYSGQDWRGELDERFAFKPTVNVAVSYRF